MAAGVSVDASGNVLVSDTWNHRIQLFTNTGSYLIQWGTNGAGDGQFNAPYGVAADSFDNFFVSDFHNLRVQKFAYQPTPVQATTWGRIKSRP